MAFPTQVNDLFKGYMRLLRSDDGGMFDYTISRS